MSRRDYKTTRNKSSKEFLAIPRVGIKEKQINQLTIQKLFCVRTVSKMTDWEKQFIDSLKNACYKWSQKQIQTLRKIEKKYADNQTKNQNVSHP